MPASPTTRDPSSATCKTSPRIRSSWTSCASSPASRSTRSAGSAFSIATRRCRRASCSPAGTTPAWGWPTASKPPPTLRVDAERDAGLVELVLLEILRAPVVVLDLVDLELALHEDARRALPRLERERERAAR